MEVIPDQGIVRSIMVAFSRGEDVLQGLRDYVKSAKLDTGFIMSGIGSFDVCNLHYITSTDLPPRDEYLTLRGPIEIGALHGSISGGEPHVHIVVQNWADGKSYCGHLEPGSRCCYRVELGLIVLEHVKSLRHLESRTGLIDIVKVGEQND